MIEKYEHHGKKVYVREDLKGKHRYFCLCFKCKKLNIGDPSKNCAIANIIYNICVKYNLVLPVWECPNFEKERKGKKVLNK